MNPADITKILDALSRRPLSRPSPNIVQLAGRLIADVEEGSGMYGAVDPNGPEPMAEALVCLGHLWEATDRPVISPILGYRGPPCSQEYWLATVAVKAWALAQYAVEPTRTRGDLRQIIAGEAVVGALVSIAALGTGEKNISDVDAVAALPDLLSDLLPRRGAGNTALPSVTP